MAESESECKSIYFCSKLSLQLQRREILANSCALGNSAGHAEATPPEQGPQSSSGLPASPSVGAKTQNPNNSISTNACECSQARKPWLSNRGRGALMRQREPTWRVLRKSGGLVLGRYTCSASPREVACSLRYFPPGPWDGYTEVARYRAVTEQRSNPAIFNLVHLMAHVS